RQFRAMIATYTRRELMVVAAAREIRDGEVVFVGMRLPLLGFGLAKATHAPNAVGLFENGVIRDRPAEAFIYTMGDPPNIAGAVACLGLNDVMSLLQQGRVDVGFIGGAEIDPQGNLNTTRTSSGGLLVRLPGSGGGGDIAMGAVASVWSPTEEQARNSRLRRFMQEHGCASYPELCRRAAEEPRWVWEALVKELGIVWSSPYQDVMDTSAGIPFTRWFPGGRLNAYESAVLRHRKTDPSRLAIIAETESGATRRLTYAELDDAVERTAAGLRAIGVDRGVAVGLYLPLVIENAVALLAITKLGAIAVP